MRTTMLAAILTLSALAPAAAQDFTAAQRPACKADYEQFCKGTVPGGGRILACLNKQRDQLSAACKQVVDPQKK